jgi:hypothetical protein
VDFAKEDPTKMYSRSEGEGEWHRVSAPAPVESEEAPTTEVSEEDETEIDENAF